MRYSTYATYYVPKVTLHDPKISDFRKWILDGKRQLRLVTHRKMTAVMILVDSVQEFLSHVRSRLIVVLKRILHQVVYYSFQTNEKSRDPDETKSQKTKFQDYVFWISFPKNPEIANALFTRDVAIICISFIWTWTFFVEGTKNHVWGVDTR